jgi:hypothetical protein
MVDAFSPIRIRGMELGNRFMRSATNDTSADESGAVTDKSISIYKRLGDGDIGLIVSGYAFVSAHGQLLLAGVSFKGDIRNSRNILIQVNTGCLRVFPCVESILFYRRSATLNLALRLRGLASLSSGEGIMAFRWISFRVGT